MPWRAALDALPNQGDASLNYDEWFRVVAGIHAETGGSEDGLALAQAWSARSGKHDPAFLESRVWPHIRDREGGVTGRTIMSLAAKTAGWSAPIEIGNDFGPVACVEVEAVPGQQGARENGATGREIASAGVPGGRAAAVDDDEDHFERDRAGVIKPTVSNTVRACRSARLAGCHIGWDEFRDEITVGVEGAGAGEGADGGCATWRPIVDSDQVRVRMRLEALGFKEAAKGMVSDAVMLVASENRYDSARQWLEGVTAAWDGVRRVDGFMTRYLGVTDSVYARAVARYVWTALAGRVLDPGCQADMVVILSGEQGLRKSGAIAALAPSRDFFVEIDLNDDEDKLARVCRGTLVAELAELSGLHTREREAIKKYVVRRHEKWVPKFKEFATTYLRRQVFFGTTNQVDILADETGERRWLPCLCARTDVEAIERDREQLWAEGALMFRGILPAQSAGILRLGVGGQGGVWQGGGVAWEDAECLARLGDVHAAFTQDDPWADAVGAWLADSDSLATFGASGVEGGARGDSPFAIADLMSGALGIAVREQDMRTSKRVGSLLKRLGYVNKDTRLGGGRVGKRWHKTKP